LGEGIVPGNFPDSGGVQPPDPGGEESGRLDIPKEVAMARRLLASLALTVVLLVAGSGAALACGGLVAPGHAEVLQKATTLAAWHAGYEHYVTGFAFAGSAADFGYIVPLPGVPDREGRRLDARTS
jgi:hypothetical protein